MTSVLKIMKVILINLTAIKAIQNNQSLKLKTVPSSENQLQSLFIFTFAVPRMAVTMAQSATFSTCTSPRIAGGLTKGLSVALATQSGVERCYLAERVHFWDSGVFQVK